MTLEATRIRAGVPVPVASGRDPECFVTIDPGVHGAISWSKWDNGRPVSLLLCAFRGDLPRVGAWIKRNRGTLLRASSVLVEEPIAIGSSRDGAGSALQLASTAGMVAGVLGWTLGVPVSWVPPASWQTILGPDRTKKLPGEKYGQTKPRALELARVFLAAHHGGSLASYTKADAEGVADAVGFMIWRGCSIAAAATEGTETWCDRTFGSLDFWRPPMRPTSRRRTKAKPSSSRRRSARASTSPADASR